MGYFPATGEAGFRLPVCCSPVTKYQSCLNIPELCGSEDCCLIVSLCGWQLTCKSPNGRLRTQAGLSRKARLEGQHMALLRRASQRHKPMHWPRALSSTKAGSSTLSPRSLYGTLQSYAKYRLPKQASNSGWVVPQRSPGGAAHGLTEAGQSEA